jgi:Ring finger domain
MDYVETDEIAELKCDKRHFFHAQCLEAALKKKLECPICRAPIKPEDQK